MSLRSGPPRGRSVPWGRPGGTEMNLRRSLGWAAAALVLALVFAAYLRPDLAMTLANQLWACF